MCLIKYWNASAEGSCLEANMSSFLHASYQVLTPSLFVQTYQGGHPPRLHK